MAPGEITSAITMDFVPPRFPYSSVEADLSRYREVSRITLVRTHIVHHHHRVVSFGHEWLKKEEPRRESGETIVSLECTPKLGDGEDMSVKSETKQVTPCDDVQSADLCTCDQKKLVFTRGKLKKALPCVRCLMRLFMTVFDSKKAAKECRLSTSTFKKLLRQKGIRVYPSRILKSITMCIAYLENELSMNKQDKPRMFSVTNDLSVCRLELQRLKERLEAALRNTKDNPSLESHETVSEAFYKVRQRIHKRIHKRLSREK